MLSVSSVLLVISAPFMGSFIANFAVRLPEGRSIVRGRSCCARCGASLRAIDLVPTISWLSLRGKCRYCSGKISGFYSAAELATFAIAVWAASICQGWLLAATFCFGCWLLLLAIIDGQHYWLPDVLTLPLIPAGLLVSWLLQPSQLIDHVVGAVSGYLLFYCIAKLYRLLRKRDGLGLGDAKFLAALGAWVSWISLPDIIALSAMGGLGFAALRWIVLKRPVGSREQIAFGPFLAMAGWLVWLDNVGMN
jgi:leader peptidase (prepilin peptidase)/N-methyltransferase